ncbi:TPA: hypothetical protein N0F65_011670 [Lagenidium giganteum]|uniref:Uncharacterized protein n=1 Tax=Lagenidium giganteum TaxID=4803 RepID=A0AAV2Z7H5_9STRA|nr:TPA: hypothetical protein N0F65_011670 [Lagenidium giganteum]
MADSTWQASLSSQLDERAKEWMCLERRYHAKRVLVEDTTADSASTRISIVVSLSDPDLPAALKGERAFVVKLPEAYPQQPPQFDFGDWNVLTPEQQCTLTNAMTSRAKELSGSFSMRKLLTWLDNNITRIVPMPVNATIEDGPAETVDDTTATPRSETKQNEDSAAKKPKRKGKSNKLCHFYGRGKCESGDNCRFVHAKRTEKQTAPATSANGGTSDEQTECATQETDSTKETVPREPEVAASDEENGDGAEPDGDESAGKSKRYCRYFARGHCKQGDRCKFSHERKKKERKTKRKAKAASEVAAPSETAEPSAPKVVVIGSPKSSTSDPLEWTNVQQVALDTALKKYPPSTGLDMKTRWTKIASEVPEKNLSDCIDRYKHLCALVKNMEQEPAASNPNEAAEETSNIDGRIIPQSERVEVETEPAVRGTQIRLDDLFLHQLGTVIPHRLVCQVQCDKCPLTFDAKLALNSPSIQKWCPRCSVKHSVTLRPVFAHIQSTVVAYIDSENCHVADVLPSEFLATCLECNTEVLFDTPIAGKRAERTCFACHAKLALMFKRYAVGHVSTDTGSTKLYPSESSPVATKKKPVKHRITENFVLGQPLPNKGACDHYRHSFRWFRFQCCGKAFPCDVCHDSSDCAEANLGKIASRMICGLCSKEQPSSNKSCSCGNEVGKKTIKTNHWEGGSGCRNQTLMSQLDKKKYRGLAKTESQKHKRVGAKGS